MINQANLVEIFSSIQGEGPYTGARQVFIRFSGCNLSCDYCDTKFNIAENCIVFEKKDTIEIKNPISAENLVSITDKFLANVKHHSISLTGGEPLLHTNFLKEFIPLFKEKYPQVKIYLETNGTLYNELNEIINFVDIIAADIKIKSSTNSDFLYNDHQKFIEIAKKYNKEIFVKAIITKEIQDEEIQEVTELLSELKDVILILQPVWSNDEDIRLTSDELIEIQDKFLNKLSDVRIIPQTHKYLDLL